MALDDHARDGLSRRDIAETLRELPFSFFAEWLKVDPEDCVLSYCQGARFLVNDEGALFTEDERVDILAAIEHLEAVFARAVVQCVILHDHGTTTEPETKG